MRLDRRRALGLLAAGAAGAPAGALAQGRRHVGKAQFLHGVASGDPLADRVVIWTRATLADPGATAEVEWTVAADADFRRPVARGKALASPVRDHTVKVDVTGLEPGHDYHYRFAVGGVTSPAGRLRTLPGAGADRIVLAATSCALYPNGYYNAYDHISRMEQVDAVLALGDYIYEHGSQADDYGAAMGQKLGRVHQPAHDIVSLADYRTRYAQYRSDPDLQAAHARAAWICVWDDHEGANDDWSGGAQNHDPRTQGFWLDRELAAMRAYYEWMPIREPEPGRAFEAINRTFHFGDLASLIMLETRLTARSRQLDWGQPEVPMGVFRMDDKGRPHRVEDPAVVSRMMAEAAQGRLVSGDLMVGPDVEGLNAILSNPERQMLGARQELWLQRELEQSVAAGRTWQVLGNQIVMARHNGPNMFGQLGVAGAQQMIAGLPEAVRVEATRMGYLFAFNVPASLDGWDGYPAARERVYRLIRDSKANAVVLAGDSHAFWVNALTDAKGAPVAAEFGTSAVTSPSWGDDLGGMQLGDVFAAQNPEVKFSDQLAKGYLKLTLTREEAVGELVATPHQVKPYEAKSLGAWRVRPGGQVEKV